MGDFRSDTVTLPTLGMGQAMLAAVVDGSSAVGDDVMGEDATIARLEARVAALLGKAAAVYVPTCTMANLLAVGAQCGRGDEVILGCESHIFVYEQVRCASPISSIAHVCAPARSALSPPPPPPPQGGASWLMGAPFHVLTNDINDGTLALADVSAALALRGGGVDSHHARVGLIAIENTANRCGGAALPHDQALG